MSRFGQIGHRLYTGGLSFDFTGKWRRWFIISAVIIVVAILGVAGRGMNFSIEFRGGVDMQVIPDHRRMICRLCRDQALPQRSRVGEHVGLVHEG